MIEKADLNYKDQHGTTALMACACCNHHEIAEKLLEKKIDLNAQLPISGLTALLWGTQHNANETILLMIKAGVDVNLCDNDGQSALHIAAGAGNFILVKALIEANANINVQDNKGNTPLMRLAASGHGEEGITASAALLLAAGAMYDTANERGEAPLGRLQRNTGYSGIARYPAVIDLIVKEQRRRAVDMVNRAGRSDAAPRKLILKRPNGR